MKHTSGKDFSRGFGNFLETPGVYHMIVLKVEEPPILNSKGNVVPNAKFRVQFGVLAGTVSGQEDKSLNQIFFHNLATEKGAAFDIKKMDRFFIATGLMTQADKEKSLDIDLQAMVGRHVIMRVDQREHDGKVFTGMSGADVYHIDDSDVVCPRSESALALIPAAHRKIGEQPAPPPAKPGLDIDSIDL